MSKEWCRKKDSSIEQSTGQPKTNPTTFRTYVLKPLKIAKDLNTNGVKVGDTIQYIKYYCLYSQEGGKAVVYEIEAYSDGINVALNGTPIASSSDYDPKNTSGDSAKDGDIRNVNDGNTESSWRSGTSDTYPSYGPTYPDSPVPGCPTCLYRDTTNYYDSATDSTASQGGTDCKSKAYIIIDLKQQYLIDSIRLYLYSTNPNTDPMYFPRFKQTFGLCISKDTTQVWDTIGRGYRVTRLTWQNQ